MSRPGITQEQVAHAADTLAAAGEPVTIPAIRATLGAGSFTTISHHLRRWREQHRTEQESMPTPLPAELDAVANKAILSIWQTASAIAKREVDALRSVSQLQVADARREADEALQEVLRLEDQLEQLAQKAVSQADELKRSEIALAQCQAEREAGRRRESELLAQVNELRAELMTARTQIEQRIQECGVLQGELAVLRAPRTERKSSPRRQESTLNR